MLIKSHDSALYPNLEDLPPRQPEYVCVICANVFKSTSGLKRHMKILKDNIPHSGPINSVKVTLYATFA